MKVCIISGTHESVYYLWLLLTCIQTKLDSCFQVDKNESVLRAVFVQCVYSVCVVLCGSALMARVLSQQQSPDTIPGPSSGSAVHKVRRTHSRTSTC